MNAPCAVAHDAVGQTRAEQPGRFIHSHAALRGVAALLVVAYHLQLGAPHRLAIETATPFFQRGYLLVDLFFILSGFVMSLTSDVDRGRRFTAVETRQFYVARLARIYPLHVFCLCFVVVATFALTAIRHWHHAGTPGPWLDDGAAGSFVAEFFLIQAWIPGAPRWNIPSWSISAELVAYALFPILLLLRHRVPRLATIVMTLVPLAFYVAVIVRGGSLDIIAGWAPLRCLSGFMIGMILYDLRHAAARWPAGTVAACQLVSVLAILAVLATRCPDPVAIPFFALLVLATWQDRGPVPAVLKHRLLARGGELSYSIYLNHVCLISVILPIWFVVVTRLDVAPDAARIALILVCLATILLASRWTYVHVEQPGRRLMRRMLAAPR